MSTPKLDLKAVIDENGKVSIRGLSSKVLCKTEDHSYVTLTDICRVDSVSSDTIAIADLSSEPNPRTRWTCKATQDMINIVKQKRPLFDTQLTNESVWDIIQAIMCKDNVYYFTATQMRNRFHNLKRTFKKHKESVAVGEGYPSDFPFWNDFEEMFGKSPRMIMAEDRANSPVQESEIDICSDGQNEPNNERKHIDTLDTSSENTATNERDFEFSPRQSINVSNRERTPQLKWSVNATHVLLAIFKETYKLFETSLSSGSVWAIITEKLAKKGYSQFTQTQIRNRMFNLKRSYRKHKVLCAKTGADPTFLFWYEFEELFGSDEKINNMVINETSKQFLEIGDESMVSLCDDTDYDAMNFDNSSIFETMSSPEQKVFDETPPSPKRRLLEESASKTQEVVTNITTLPKSQIPLRRPSSSSSLEDILQRFRREAESRFERSMMMRKAELDERRKIRKLMEKLIDKF